MSTNEKTMRALDGFSGVTDNDVVNRWFSVQTKMTGNLYFPNPPVDLAVLKTDIETLSALSPNSGQLVVWMNQGDGAGCKRPWSDLKAL